jgi:hypothetical protein
MGHRKRLQQFAAIGVRIQTHATMARRRQRGEFLAELSLLVEQLLRLVALHPVFELLQMFRIFEIRNRNLVRAPRALDRQSIDEFRSGPALRCAKHDHRPARALHAVLYSTGACDALDLTNLSQDPVERPCKTLMHQRGIVTLDEIRIVAVAT